MFGDGRKEKLLADLLEGVGDADAVPVSALKDLRGGISQRQLALKSGLTQGYLSEVEAGKRRLTLKSAEAIAPVLGIKADQLMWADAVGGMQAEAVEGELDPRAVLDMVLELSARSGNDEVADEVLDSLLVVLKKALSTYRSELAERKAARDAGETEQEQQQVSTKSHKREPTRDGNGIRREKPYDPPKGS